MYEVEFDPAARDQAAHLPLEALAPLLELRATLALAPWGGEPVNPDNAGSNILTLPFGPQGRGMVTYMVLEDQRRVAVLQIIWLG